MTSESDGIMSTTEFFHKFPHERAAIAYLENRRWPNGITCPLCGAGSITRPILHVFAQGRDQLQAPFEELLKEGLREIATVADQLTPQIVAHLWHRFAVIYIARRELKSQQFTLVIDNQMELEAIEPAHTALAACGHISKEPMAADALVVADGQRGRIDKCHPCRLAETPIQIEIQGWQGGWHQLHNARVTDQTGKFTAHMLAYLLRVIRFEITIMRLMKVDQNRHHFTQAQTRRRSAFACHPQQLGILPGSHPLTKIIDMTEQFEYTHLKRLSLPVGFG